MDSKIWTPALIIRIPFIVSVLFIGLLTGGEDG